MSNSSLAVKSILSPNYNKRTQKISKITFHHAAGVLTAEALANCFTSPSRQASANYCIGNDGTIVLCVPENCRTWTSGSEWNDQRAITVEVSNSQIGGEWKISDAALKACVALATDVCKRNKIKSLKYTGNKNGSLTTHKMFQATLCPGPYLESKLPYIATQVNKALKAKPTKDNKISVTYQVWDNVQNKWLPNVTDLTDYAGIYGHDICGVFANLTKGNIYYKVHTKGGKWLPQVKNRKDYAGILNKPIDALMMKTNTGKKIHYAVHLKKSNKWLPFVTGYNAKDSNNGYAGILGQEIDAIKIYLE